MVLFKRLLNASSRLRLRIIHSTTMWVSWAVNRSNLQRRSEILRKRSIDTGLMVLVTPLKVSFNLAEFSSKRSWMTLIVLRRRRRRLKKKIFSTLAQWTFCREAFRRFSTCSKSKRMASGTRTPWRTSAATPCTRWECLSTEPSSWHRPSWMC